MALSASQVGTLTSAALGAAAGTISARKGHRRDGAIVGAVGGSIVGKALRSVAVKHNAIKVLHSPTGEGLAGDITRGISHTGNKILNKATGYVAGGVIGGVAGGMSVNTIAKNTTKKKEQEKKASMGNKYLDKVASSRSEAYANTALANTSTSKTMSGGWQGNMESFAKKGPGLAAKGATKINKVGLLSKLTKFVGK